MPDEIIKFDIDLISKVIEVKIEVEIEVEQSMPKMMTRSPILFSESLAEAAKHLQVQGCLTIVQARYETWWAWLLISERWEVTYDNNDNNERRFACWDPLAGHLSPNSDGINPSTPMCRASLVSTGLMWAWLSAHYQGLTLASKIMVRWKTCTQKMNNNSKLNWQLL